MKLLAILLVVSAVAVGVGGALEFLYYGPGTAQFTAGLITVPASLVAIAAAVNLWRSGERARRAVRIGAGALLAATVAATMLEVMGPPATLIGSVGALLPLAWALKKNHIQRQEHQNKHD